MPPTPITHDDGPITALNAKYIASITMPVKTQKLGSLQHSLATNFQSSLVMLMPFALNERSGACPSIAWP